MIAVIAAACNSGSATPTPSPTPTPTPPAKPGTASATASGKATYDKLCAPCHGADLKGYAADHAPSLVNATFLESATDEFLRRSILQGRPGTSMGAYGKAMGGPLDDAGLDQLVAYIRSHGPVARALPPFIGRGDAAKGAAAYEQLCKTCHGDARTRGEAPHLANQAFLAIATDPFIRHAIAAGRPGTKMPAFAGALTDAQIDDLTAYVRKLAEPAARPPQEQLLPEPTGKEPVVINPKGKDPAWTPRDGRFIGVDAVAKALADKRKLVIVDARPPSDWRRVHITGAVSIPYHDLKRLADIPKDAWVVAYCACPHHLSGIVVDELIKRGHKKALVLDEGINLWHQKGYPVTAAPGVGPPAFEPHNHGHHGHDHHGHGHHGHGH